jgi:hypothetical protein
MAELVGYGKPLPASGFTGANLSLHPRAARVRLHSDEISAIFVVQPTCLTYRRFHDT